MQRTDAHALHALLAAVQKDNNKNLGVRWATVLDAKINTAEYSRRHAEVVHLYLRVVQQIESLPDAQRENFGPYRHLWWNAIIAPNQVWNTSSENIKVIEPSHLAILHNAGDVIEYRLGEVFAPNGGSLDALRQQIAEWRDTLVTERTILTSEPLRKALIHQLEHVLWLIEHADMFGAAAITGAAQEVVGSIAVATPHVPQQQRANWKVKVAAVVGAIAIFNGSMSQGTTAIENVGDIAAAAITAGEHVVDAVERE